MIATPPYQLILLRHGQSEWNRSHRLTGWSDVPLTAKGEVQARRAGEVMASARLNIKRAFVSDLARATRTMEIVADVLGARAPAIERSWRLNERHYGALEGLGPLRGLFVCGLSRLIACQRRYDVAPPLVAFDDARYPGRSERYAGLAASELPRGESMAQAYQRMTPYWNDAIAPALRSEGSILVVAHKNILRTIVKHVCNLDGPEAARLKIRTGVPWVYELDADLLPTKHRIYEQASG